MVAAVQVNQYQLNSFVASPQELLCCRFLGKLLSQHISLCVTTGKKADSSLFSAGFDYKRWEKAFKDKKVRT